MKIEILFFSDVEEADNEIGSTVYNRSQSASSNQVRLFLKTT